MTWICSQCGEKFSRFRTRCAGDGQRVIEDFAGQLIGGRYRIRELVGIGGMDSTVWKAWQTGTERVVAVKVLPVADEAAAKRFARGARIAANLNHPNCTVVHDYGRTDDGKLFLVMEYLHGQVLQEILGPEGMSAADTIHVADQVLQALEHAHGQRAVHRDLKPDNLFLSRKNDDPLHVKILDFGIAKYVDEDPESLSAEEQPSDGFEDLVTEQRQVCGTPQYMAPEQVVGARIDGRTDLYSLGVVMYRMLTGRLPFDGKTRYELYQKHLQEAPRPFAEVRPDLVFPDGLEAIVLKALNKRPDQRFASAPEMRQALAAVELPDERVRRGMRPRVSFKQTSPQGHSGLPSVATAGGMWTLQQPLPDPLAVEAAMRQAGPRVPGDSGGGAQPPPLPSGVYRARQSLLDAEALALPPDISLSAPSGHDQTADVFAAEHEAPSGAQDLDGGRSATSLLSDAVVRHPAGRSSLAVAPEVPRSTETEPNRARQASEKRRRRIGILAVLAAALLLGVGLVALVMNLGGSDGTVSEGGEGVAAAPVDRGTTPPAEEPGTAVAASMTRSDDRRPSAEALAGEQAGTALALPAKETATAEEALVDATTTTSGIIAGHALSEIPVAPAIAKVPIKIESDPPGAVVSEGPTVLGPTPLDVSVSPGRHVYTLAREGYVNAIVEIDAVLRGAGAPPIARKLVLAAERRPAPAPGWTPPKPRPESASGAGDSANKILKDLGEPSPSERSAPAGGDGKPADKISDEPRREAPKVDAASPPPTRTNPQVKLLDDSKPADKPAAGEPKKPTVKLLDDDDSGVAPKKPKVNVLGE